MSTQRSSWRSSMARSSRAPPRRVLTSMMRMRRRKLRSWKLSLSHSLSSWRRCLVTRWRRSLWAPAWRTLHVFWPPRSMAGLPTWSASWKRKPFATTPWLLTWFPRRPWKWTQSTPSWLSSRTLDAAGAGVWTFLSVFRSLWNAFSDRALVLQHGHSIHVTWRDGDAGWDCGILSKSVQWEPCPVPRQIPQVTLLHCFAEQHRYTLKEEGSCRQIGQDREGFDLAALRHLAPHIWFQFGWTHPIRWPHPSHDQAWLEYWRWWWGTWRWWRPASTWGSGGSCWWGLQDGGGWLGADWVCQIVVRIGLWAFCDHEFGWCPSLCVNMGYLKKPRETFCTEQKMKNRPCTFDSEPFGSMQIGTQMHRFL